MLTRWRTVLAAMALLAAPVRVVADETKPAAPLGTWQKGEGFRLKSADGNWKLRVGLQAAFQYEPRFPEGGPNNWSNFPLPYVRPSISGTLLRPWIEYWCSLEFRQFPPFLLDCYMDIRPWKSLGSRAGQFWTLLSRHEYLGPQELVFASWAPTADYFWTGRDRGVQLFGETPYIDWYTSITAGTTLTQTTTVPGNFQLQGRVSINPLGAVGPTEIPWIATDKAVPFRFSRSRCAGLVGPCQSERCRLQHESFLVLTPQGERDYGTGAVDFLIQWRGFGFFTEALRPARVAARRPDGTVYAVGRVGAGALHVLAARARRGGALRLDRGERFAAGHQLLLGRSAARLVHLRHLAGRAVALRRGAPGRSRAGPRMDPMLFTTVGLPTSPGWLHILTLQLQLAI